VGASADFDLSADARCVVFPSVAGTLPGANGFAQIYLRDTVAKTTTLVSQTPGGQGGDGDSRFPSITPDCRYVAWDSEATNLTATAQTQRLAYQGVFVITQTGGSKPVTQLALAGKLRCPRGKASQSARKRVRRLWGDGAGRFRTKGRTAAATVRGTIWLTEDRCNGTLVRVRRGSVSVRDLVKRKTVIVKRGKSYFARAKA